MIVIADTSPINYLVLIDAVGVLPALYQTVVIPQAVFDELQVPETPERVRAWITHPPDWFKVERGMVLPDLDFRDLDKGEIEAIALATHLDSTRKLISEQ